VCLISMPSFLPVRANASRRRCGRLVLYLHSSMCDTAQVDVPGLMGIAAPPRRISDLPELMPSMSMSGLSASTRLDPLHKIAWHSLECILRFRRMECRAGPWSEVTLKYRCAVT